MPDWLLDRKLIIGLAIVGGMQNTIGNCLAIPPTGSAILSED